ncbi:MAG: hypothetical protein A3F67_01805 [Verrucomicrobia bacterium RIFCSPHIGHO2_12_FULL_41_10]|nr:MAG: hypothetical protein A3F67_01805 [Verrucomicrobia bacterium RIFCSPHIGHO2_12_FULL_41_10]HLB34397.1 hypothetical protein [Chthoniobacterales bacterium]
MQNEWNIKSRSNTCQIKGAPFHEGDFFYTLLFHDKEGYQRLDLSEEALEERKADPTVLPPFSLWRSKYELPPPPAPEPLPHNDAEGMLRHLMESNDPSHLKTRYILALMLERKKRLRPLKSPETSTLLYEHVDTGETFIIPDPHLSLENLLEVQQEVSELLSGITTATKEEKK